LDFFANGDTKNKPFYYGLEDAIENNFLSHYNYYPIKVRLEEDEFERYQRKTLLIATEMGKKESDRDYDLLNKTRTERSLIIKKATNKLDKLREMTIDNYDFVNSVVYCGQGKDHEEPIIDSVTKILYEADLSVHTFTSKTEDRPRVLEEFERGYFDTLVAIKCFDEGVDVPKLDKIYIMASDTALRQTVQRRGRVLRKCKESGKTVGFIYDMVAFPPRGYYTEMGAKSLVVNELRRVQEYMRLADNKAEGNEFLAKAYEMYSITESDFSNEDN
jgi:superfamily II DNA or RNA helicase